MEQKFGHIVEVYPVLDYEENYIESWCVFCDDEPIGNIYGEEQPEIDEIMDVVFEEVA